MTQGRAIRPIQVRTVSVYGAEGASARVDLDRFGGTASLTVFGLLMALFGR